MPSLVASLILFSQAPGDQQQQREFIERNTKHTEKPLGKASSWLPP